MWLVAQIRQGIVQRAHISTYGPRVYKNKGRSLWLLRRPVAKLHYLFTSITIVVTTAARNTNAPNTPKAMIAPV